MAPGRSRPALNGSLVRKMLGQLHREVWPKWAARVGGVWKQTGIWTTDTVVVDVGDWPLRLAATADVAGPNQGVTCTVLKVPFHNPRGLRFTLSRAHAWHRLMRRFSGRHLQVGDPVFDKTFRLTHGMPPRDDHQAVVDLFASDALRMTLPARWFNHLTVLDHEGLTGPRFGADVDLLYYEEPRVLLREEELDALLLSFAHLIEALEGVTGLVDDVHQRLLGAPPQLAPAAPERLRALLKDVTGFFAGHVEREGDEMVARVTVPELEGEVGTLRVEIPTLPSDLASLTALLPLPNGDGAPRDLQLGRGAVVVWRDTLLDARAPLRAEALRAALEHLLDRWHFAVRLRLGFLPVAELPD